MHWEEIKKYEKEYCKYFGYNRNFLAATFGRCSVFSCELYLFGNSVSGFLYKHYYSYRNNVYSKNRIKKYFY